MNFFCLFSFQLWGQTIQGGQYFHISGFSYVKYASRLFNHFRGSQPLHTVQFLIGSNPTVDLAICFAITSPMVFLKVSAVSFEIFMLTMSQRVFFQVHLLPRGDWWPDLHTPMPFLVGLFFF
jgi:hypothetical protein